MTDISVRSALSLVRWNDIPVRRDESSVEIAASLDDDVIRVPGSLSMAISFGRRRTLQAFDATGH